MLKSRSELTHFYIWHIKWATEMFCESGIVFGGFVLTGKCYMGIVQQCFISSCQSLIWANSHFPKEVSQETWTSSTEASGTSICPLIPGYLLFAFIITSLWKGYFPSWKREAGILLPSPQESTLAAWAWNRVLEFPWYSHNPRNSGRECSLWKGHSTVLGKVSKCYYSLNLFSPGKSSHLQCFEFIHSCHVTIYIAERQSVC